LSFENVKLIFSLLSKAQLLFAVIAGSLLLQSAMAGQKINKCRDASGVWHYGDFAAQACENAKVHRIDSSGVELSVDTGPTAAQKKHKIEQLKALKKLRKNQLAQQKKDRHLLRLYDSEQAVIDARDKHLSAIDQEISSNRSLSAALIDARKNLMTRLAETTNAKTRDHLASLLGEYTQQISAYQQVEQDALKRRQTVKSKYNRDLAAFQDLLRRQAQRAGQAAQ